MKICKKSSNQYRVGQKSPDYCYNALKNENNFVIDTNLVNFFSDTIWSASPVTKNHTNVRIVHRSVRHKNGTDSRHCGKLFDTVQCLHWSSRILHGSLHAFPPVFLVVRGKQSLLKLPKKRSPLGWGQEIWQASLPFLCVRSIQMATLHQGRFGRRMRNSIHSAWNLN